MIVRAPGTSAFSAVTQDDRGRLWAVREPARRWERYSPAGRRLGKPFNTAGAGLALHYDPVAQPPGLRRPARRTGLRRRPPAGELGHPRAARPCRSLRDPARAKYFVAQFNAPNVTDCCHNADITAGLDTGGLAWPSWLHDGTFIAAPFSNLLKGYGIWYVPPRIPELRYWFGPTNNALRLAHPEVTRRGDRIAATIDTHNALSKDEEITVGHLPGPPPAVPDRDCTWANPHGTVAGLHVVARRDHVGVVGRRRRVDRALRGAHADGPRLRGHGEAPARARGDVAGLESRVG